MIRYKYKKKQRRYKNGIHTTIACRSYASKKKVIEDTKKKKREVDSVREELSMREKGKRK